MSGTAGKAGAKGADGAPPAGGMDPKALKKHLKLGRKQAVGIAFALGADGKMVIQMHRSHEGRQISGELKKTAPGCKSLRWGSMTVNPKEPKAAVIDLNSAVTGVARKLVLAMRGTGFNKVRLMYGGQEVESEQGEDDGVDPSAEDDEDWSTEEAADKGNKPPSDTEKLQDLANEVTQLMKRATDVIGRQPGQKNSLMQLAAAAQKAVKDRDVRRAETAMDAFREGVDNAEDGATATPQPGAAPSSPAKGVSAPSAADLARSVTDMMKTLLPAATKAGLGDQARELGAKAQQALKGNNPADIQTVLQQMQALQKQAAAGATSSGPAASSAPPSPPSVDALHAAHGKRNEQAKSLWGATRQRLHRDIEKMIATIDQALDQAAVDEKVKQAVRQKTHETLGHLDGELEAELDAVNGAKDPAERAKRVTQAQAHIQRYQQHVSSDEAIKMLEQNPFIKVDIKDQVMKALDMAARMVR